MRTLHTLLLVISLSPLACGSGGRHTVPLNPTVHVPAAKGTVETKRTENENTAVDVEVHFLAPPQKVVSGATAYVVWAQPLAQGSKPQNIGSMLVGADRKASLKTKTPFENFELFLTPESNANATEPSNEPVMKAKIAR